MHERQDMKRKAFWARKLSPGHPLAGPDGYLADVDTPPPDVEEEPLPEDKDDE